MEDQGRVYAYDKGGEYKGYIRLGEDEQGERVGEVYDPEANKLGAVRLADLEVQEEESLVYEPDDNRQVGYVRLQRYEAGVLGGDIFWNSEPTDDLLAHVHYDPKSGKPAEVHKKKQWGELIGTLKPEKVSDIDVVLMGGAAALLILM